MLSLADRVIDFFSGEIPLRRNEHPIQWVVAPVVAYAPETSWQFGVGGKVLFRLEARFGVVAHLVRVVCRSLHPEQPTARFAGVHYFLVRRTLYPTR